MLRPSTTLLVGLLMVVSAATVASAQSPDIDWQFEAGGAGWRASSAAFALATPAQSGATAGRLTAFSTAPMRLATLLPQPSSAGGTATASAWVLAAPAEVARTTLQIEAFSDGFAPLARREAAVPSGEAFVPVEVVLALPQETAYVEVSVAAVPVHEGARLLVDAASLALAPAASPAPSASPTPTSTALPSATPTASPVPTRTPTSSPTPRRTPSPSPTPAATPAVFPMLTNGGFEDPRGLSGWSAQGGGTATGVAGAQGHAALLTSSSSGTTWLQQAVAASPGGWYRASAWLRMTEGSDAWLRVAWYASDDASGGQIAVDDSPFTDAHGAVVAVEVRAPLDARSARVRLMLRPVSAATATLEADDVRFEAVSPPVLPPAPSVAAAGPLPEHGAELPARAPGSAPARGGEAMPPAGPTSGVEAAPAVRAVEAVEAGPARHSLLRITELLPDPVEPGPDADFEWVEIANLGSAPESLAGFTLQDNGGAVELPPLEVPAGAALVLAAARAQTAGAPLVHTLERGISNGLGNAGDRVALRSPEGNVVDAVSWGSDRTYALGLPELPAPASGRSVLRRFTDDGSFADAVESANPTPGDWLDSRAVPAEHAPAHLATLDARSDRGWALLLAIAGVALALAGADRLRRVLHAR